MILPFQNKNRSISTNQTEKQFRECLKEAKNLVVLTGAGVSAESGIPTFRGEGGLWRKHVAQVF